MDSNCNLLPYTFSGIFDNLQLVISIFLKKQSRLFYKILTILSLSMLYKTVSGYTSSYSINPYLTVLVHVLKT